MCNSTSMNCLPSTNNWVHLLFFGGSLMLVFLVFCYFCCVFSFCLLLFCVMKGVLLIKEKPHTNRGISARRCYLCFSLFFNIKVFVLKCTLIQQKVEYTIFLAVSVFTICTVKCISKSISSKHQFSI